MITKSNRYGPRRVRHPLTSEWFMSLFSIHAVISFPVQRDTCIPDTQDVLPPHPIKTLSCEQNTQYQLYKLQFS